MGTTIIENVKGIDIPSQWTRQIKDDLDSTFTLIIKRSADTENKSDQNKWDAVADRFLKEYSLMGKSEEVSRIVREFRENYI
ncbi:MAG: hypothetical protein HQL87_09495 [Magnetococcales bacterium]|nr:hypothetical protein [Magnetococcales bacterium]